MKNVFNKYKSLFILLAIFLICELIANPVGEFPLNDDWAYAQAVKILNNTFVLDFGPFPAMTLLTHIVWGSLFTKLFGFSFILLRISTLISALIGFIFLNNLVVKLGGSKTAGLVACLTLMLNPIFFNLSNTYMTDVNFNTLCILCIYFAHSFFTTHRRFYLIAFTLASMALVLLRQYGIVFPVCFLAANLFLVNERKRNLMFSVLSVLLTVIILKLFESYLKLHLPAGSTYKFSRQVDPLSSAFWENLSNSFFLRYKEIVQHLLVYTSPVALLFLGSVLKHLRKEIIVAMVINSFVFTCFFFSGQWLTSQNIFTGLMIGPESFFESFTGHRHNSFPKFDGWLLTVKMILSFITLFVFFSSVIISFIKTNNHKKINPNVMLLWCFIFAYSFMIIITESYFDRYHLPLITAGVILFTTMTRDYDIQVRFATVPLVFFAWISIAGTKDYFELNRQRWDAYRFLRSELKIPKDKINAGFEVSCWNDGVSVGWVEFITLEGFDYLIQFNKPPGFKTYKEYSFQRYLPYKQDKINIFVRDTIK